MRLQAKQYVDRVLDDPMWALVGMQRRVWGMVSHRVFTEYSPFPQMIMIWPTYLCNLRCSFCAQWGTEGTNFNIEKSELKGSLSLDELKALVDDVATYRPMLTLMGGGEPTLFKGWLEFVEYASSKNCPVVLVSNGLTLERKAEDIVKAGLGHLTLSIDGPPEVHDKLRGVKGSYEKTMNTARAIVAAKKKLGKRNPHLNMTCTISNNNYKDLDQMVDRAVEAGFDDITFNHLLFLDSGTYEKHKDFFQVAFGISHENYWSGFVSDNHDGIPIDELVEIVERVRRRKDITVRMYPAFDKDEVLNYYQDPDFYPKSKEAGCRFPWYAGIIYPNGDVSPCPNYVAGNIKEKSFSTIFNDDPYREIRRGVKEHGLFPACSKCCLLYFG